MPITQFQNGVSSFGIPLIGSGPILTTGKILFVSSVAGNDGNNGTDSTAPLATVKQALSLCTANNGDFIIVMPGHAESVISAGALAFNKAGVSLVGLGVGATRPTFTMSTATSATITVTAADVSIKNIRITTSVDELVNIISCTAARLTLDTVDYFETATKQALNFLLTTAAAVELQMLNCTHIQKTAAAANSIWITLTGADRFTMKNCFIDITTTNSASSNIVNSVTTAPVDIFISGCTFMQIGSTAVVPVKLLTGTTGIIRDCHVISTQTTLTASIVLASVYASQVFASHTVNTNAILTPVADV